MIITIFAIKMKVHTVEGRGEERALLCTPGTRRKKREHVRTKIINGIEKKVKYK